MLIPWLSPFAFKIGSFGIHWYGIFMVLAILGGGWYLLERGQQLGLDTDRLSTKILWTIFWGVVGARLVFVLANKPQWIWTDPIQALKIWDGGLAIDGAVGLGILALYIQMRNHKVVFNHLIDWMVPGVGLGIFAVRIGNIFNHEVIGHVTQLGFGRWPEQLIGSSWGIVLIVRYFWLERHRATPPGYQFWSAMFYYSILRGVIGETTRANPIYLVYWSSAHWGLAGITLMQWFTIPLLIFTGIMMRRTWRKSARENLVDTAMETLP